MIEAALLTLAMGSMVFLVWAVNRSSKPGAHKTLGIFSYPELDKDGAPGKQDHRG